jgi:DNA modification methylase
LIINADCFDEIKKIKTGSIDLILIDPPYGISKKSNFNIVSDNASDFIKTKYSNHSIDFGDWDVDIDFDFLFSEYYRVLKSGGTLIIFYDIWKSHIIKDLAKKYKFKQPRVAQWVKTNPTPINSKTNYLSNASEYFFTFVKGKNPTFNSEYDNGIYRYPLCHGKERLNHPTQKPIKLICDLIKKHSNEGDTILDTFSGTGTTAEACYLTNRNFLCIEKNLEYYNLSVNRIKQYLNLTV